MATFLPIPTAVTRKSNQTKKFESRATTDKKQGINPTPKGSLEQYLQYPSDIGTSAQTANYILFTTYKRTPAKMDFSKDKKHAELTDAINAAALTGDMEQEGKLWAARKKREKELLGARGAISNKRTPGDTSLHMRQGHTKSGTTIALYMPPSVNAKYMIPYDDKPIGFMSEAIYSFIKDVQAGASWDQAAKQNAGPVGTGLTRMGLGFLDAAIPGTKDLVAMERGTIIAPRTEVMFQGISKRTFSFSFTFIPKSEDETKTIDKIIYEFKRAMTPAFKNEASGNVRELNFPEMFSIAYMHQNVENQYINKIGRCFLESCDVSYGGERFVTFEPNEKGAPPNKITMALGFREIEIVDQAKIDKGF